MLCRVIVASTQRKRGEAQPGCEGLIWNHGTKLEHSLLKGEILHEESPSVHHVGFVYLFMSKYFS